MQGSMQTVIKVGELAPKFKLPIIKTAINRMR